MNRRALLRSAFVGTLTAPAAVLGKLASSDELHLVADHDEEPWHVHMARVVGVPGKDTVYVQVCVGPRALREGERLAVNPATSLWGPA